jgi:hypothetical protein
LRTGIRRGWLLGAAALYVASLWLPAIEGSGFPAQTGLDVLRQGASAWSDGVVAWYANPLLWLALVLGWLGRRRLGLACATLGLALALSSFSAGFVAEQAGQSVPPFSFAAGFYVWLGAFVLALIGLFRD